MFEKFALRLEDSKNPLLGPTIFGLKAWGMWQPNGFSVLYNLIHLFALLFVLSQYIQLWIIRSDLAMALRNLSVSMLSTICVVKATTFVFWHRHWRSIIEYVSLVEKDQLNKKDEDTHTIIKEYTKYSRKVTYFYWWLVTATVITVILAPLGNFLSSPELREKCRNGTLPYPEILSSWFPFNTSRGIGYWVSVMEHSLICCYGGGIVATYDSNAVVLMSFFTGQLKILAVRCSKLFGIDDEDVSYEDVMEGVKECFCHHVLLIKYAKKLDSLLSPVMFLYVIICSLMICASAVQLVAEGTTTMQQLWIAEYLLALIAQLFLYCWHSNEVMFMSLKVDRGIYESLWWKSGANIRRCMILLGGQLRKTVVFTAGPFTSLTVATFVAILKGSYSYYTLLSKKDN